MLHSTKVPSKVHSYIVHIYCMYGSTEVPSKVFPEIVVLYRLRVAS